MKILVATASYNEAANIGEFIGRVRATLGAGQEILVVDDNSPDGTSARVNEIRKTDAAVHVITRPYKFGLGSAHKLMMVQAMALGYEYLVTMDSDLSHSPEEIPALLARAGKNRFVTGSRYVIGGACDYTGFRKVISRCGNVLARLLLRMPLREYTTSFRVFDVNLLKRCGISRLRSNGYSFFIESASLLDEIGAEVVEVPIHFKDRKNDVSKIPRSQALKSLFNLVRLGLRRRCAPLQALSPSTEFRHCRFCGEQALIPLWAMDGEEPLQQLSAADFHCSSIQAQAGKPVLLECHCCGSIQSFPLSKTSSVVDLYATAEDEIYLANFRVKLRTFRKAYQKIARYLPDSHLKVLDIGSYYGAFLEVLKEKGHHGWGIEPSQAAARYSGSVLGHPVINGSFSEGERLQGASFDMVTAWDVIEHLEDPNRFLAAVNGLLPAGGIFVCSTIIIDSWIARFLRKRWHWIIPMHLSYFRRKEIIALLARHGFTLLAYRNHTHFASLPYALKGLGKNLPPWLSRACRFLAALLPDSAVVPIALGDVRMLVCKKC